VHPALAGLDGLAVASAFLRHFEQPKSAQERDHVPLDGGVEPGQVVDRRVDAVEVGHEHHHVAGRQLVLERSHAAHAEDDPLGAVDQKVLDQAVARFDPAAAQVSAEGVAHEHQLTPGDVVMFMAYLDRIYSPVHNLTGLYSAIQRNVVSLLRAFRLLEVPEEGGGDRKPIEVRECRVDFRDVEFRYREDRPVLRGINFTLEPGQVTALIGPSGAGKTTIADLVVQLYTPQ